MDVDISRTNYVIHLFSLLSDPERGPEKNPKYSGLQIRGSINPTKSLNNVHYFVFLGVPTFVISYLTDQYSICCSQRVTNL